MKDAPQVRFSVSRRRRPPLTRALSHQARVRFAQLQRDAIDELAPLFASEHAHDRGVAKSMQTAITWTEGRDWCEVGEDLAGLAKHYDRVTPGILALLVWMLAQRAAPREAVAPSRALAMAGCV